MILFPTQPTNHATADSIFDHCSHGSSVEIFLEKGGRFAALDYLHPQCFLKLKHLLVGTTNGFPSNLKVSLTVQKAQREQWQKSWLFRS